MREYRTRGELDGASLPGRIDDEHQIAIPVRRTTFKRAAREKHQDDCCEKKKSLHTIETRKAMKCYRLNIIFLWET